MNNTLFKGKSKINGTGIFANGNIKKGDPFYVIPTDCVFDEPKSKLAYIGKNKWVSDEKALNYANHSCDSNAILDISDKPCLIAKRDISPEEEITVDYNLTEKEGRKVPCTCGSKNCRGYFLRIE